MDDLQIMALDQNDITTWNFESIKANLKSALSVYQNTVYTDETIKSAKDDKATLARAKKLVEDRRKAYKEQCLAPYTAIEPRIKELVTMIEDQRLLIDGVVKDYTDRQKQEKEKEVRAYYDRKAAPLGDLSSKLFEKLLDPKWLNASTKRAKYEEEVQLSINNAARDIQFIRAMDSPFVDTLLETYVRTLSMEEVQRQAEELKKAHEKAGFSEQPTATFHTTEAVPVGSSPEADKEKGTILRVYASQNQLGQIMDFMKAIGVQFDVQQDV